MGLELTHNVPILVTLSLCFIAASFALNVEISPLKVNELITDKVNVKCLTNDSPDLTQKVLVFSVGKSGQDSIATISQTHGVQYGKNKIPNMQAEGVIKKNASDCHLTLTINNPSVKDGGLYFCELYYTDVFGQIKQAKAFGNVSVDNNDSYAVFVHLINKISGLEKEMKEKETEIKDLQEQYEDNLEKVKQEQEKQLNALTKKFNDERNVQECPLGWTHSNLDRTCIKVFGLGEDKKLNWADARKECQNKGGDLVIVKGNWKNSLVYNLMRESQEWAWIGMKNTAAKGFNFQYVDESLIGTFHPWEPGQPDGHNTRLNKCVGISSYRNHLAGKWDDAYCTALRSYVCSIPAHR